MKNNRANACINYKLNIMKQAEYSQPNNSNRIEKFHLANTKILTKFIKKNINKNYILFV